MKIECELASSGMTASETPTSHGLEGIMNDFVLKRFCMVLEGLFYYVDSVSWT